MVAAGIEAMNVYGGLAYLDVFKLFAYRGLDTARFDNLMMKQKTVALPFEDPITFGVNAAKPIVDALSEEERNRIELLITCTESGIDFGKSISTYLHHYLGLNRHCRLFEIKNACYSGTAGLQTAISYILSQASPGSKALVVATDISRMMAVDPGAALDWDMAFTEPSSGAGAVAMLVSDRPHIFQIDVGASGFYGYEVMDTCRPVPDCDAGNADLSLMSYLDCCEQTFLAYRDKVADVDYRDTFHYLAFHTPFGGMVKGAHRSMMRKMTKTPTDRIDADFEARVRPSLQYCQRVGNIMGATTMLALASTIDHGQFDTPKRIGCFSYGSGCCSEFFSGVVTEEGQRRLRQMRIADGVGERRELTMEQYARVIEQSGAVKFGTRNVELDWRLLPEVTATRGGRPTLALRGIKEFHREYGWLS